MRSAWLIDDESLALDRLERMLAKTGRVRILGRSTDPREALEAISNEGPDVLFLDIEMPGMTGFELLEQLESPPAVIFTTAYDRYALRAFEENSIDYLVKPIEPARLEAALDKVERLGGEPRELRALLREIAADRPSAETARFPDRLPSRLGDRIVFVELDEVTHFYSKDKLTYAAASPKDHVIDSSLSELEGKLDPARWARVHRSAIVQLRHVAELHAWFGGKMKARLKDQARTELTVSRDRVKELKARLGF